MTTALGNQPVTESRHRRGAIDGLPELRLPGLVLVAVLVLRTVLLLAADAVIVPVAHATGTTPAQASLSLNVVIVGVDVITLVVLARIMRRRGARLRDAIGPIHLGRDLLLALPITLLLAVAFLAATFLANLAVYGGAPPAGPPVSVPLWLAIWSITVMPVTVALAEETLYRGVALQALTSAAVRSSRSSSPPSASACSMPRCHRAARPRCSPGCWRPSCSVSCSPCWPSGSVGCCR